MAEIFQCQMVIGPHQLQNMLTDEDHKLQIKKRLAYELAEKIMESNRASFTYRKDPYDFTIKITGTVTL
jgi:hypothetical protein